MVFWRYFAATLILAIIASAQRAGYSQEAPSEEIEWSEWIEDQGTDDLHWAKRRAWPQLANASSTSSPRPPIFLLAGIASTRLLNWREKTCRGTNIKARDIVWVNIGKLLETKTFDPTCWVECMKVGFGGTDPPGRGECVLRPDEGLDAVSAMAPGLLTSGLSQVYAPLIQLLISELGYVGGFGSLRSLAYDWRLSPRRLEGRDGFYSACMHSLEHAVKQHRRPAIVFAHSMGNLNFLYFLNWLKAGRFQGQADAFQDWVDAHVWCYVGLSAPLLGASGALRTSLDGETFGLPISESQAREMELTFDSTHWLNPRPLGGSASVTKKQKEKNQSNRNEMKMENDRREKHTKSRHQLGNGRFGFGRKPQGTPAAGATAADLGRAKKHAQRYGDWPAELVRVRPDPRSNASVSFGVGDVSRGDLFHWLAQREASTGSFSSSSDSDSSEGKSTSQSSSSSSSSSTNMSYSSAARKAAALSEEYWNDPLGDPLALPPERPPIRHVIMAYGVDVPTDIAYRYTTAEAKQPSSSTKNGDKKSNGGPSAKGASSSSSSSTRDHAFSGGSRLVLEETVQESAGGSLAAVRVRDALTTAPVDSHSHSQHHHGDRSGSSNSGGGNDNGSGSSKHESHSDAKGLVVRNSAEEDSAAVLPAKTGWWPPLPLPQLPSAQPSSSPSPKTPHQHSQKQHKQKRGERRELRGPSKGRRSGHSGDGTVPYLSLAWAHTWLHDDSVPTVKLQARGPIKGAPHDSKDGNNGSTQGRSGVNVESPAVDDHSSGWTAIFSRGFVLGGSSNSSSKDDNGSGILGSKNKKGKKRPAPAKEDNTREARTLWRRQSSGPPSGGSSGRGKGRTRKGLGEALGDSLQTCAALLHLPGRSLLDARSKRGDDRRSDLSNAYGGDGYEGGSGSRRSQKKEKKTSIEHHPTTTTVLEVAGASHTSLTSDPGSLTVVLAHVLKLMDQDLCLTPVEHESSTSSSTTPTSTKANGDSHQEKSTPSNTMPPSAERERSGGTMKNGSDRHGRASSIVPVATAAGREGRGPLATVNRRLKGAVMFTLRSFSMPWRRLREAWKRAEESLQQLRQRRAQEEACACFSD